MLGNQNGFSTPKINPARPLLQEWKKRRPDGPPLYRCVQANLLFVAGFDKNAVSGRSRPYEHILRSVGMFRDGDFANLGTHEKWV